MHSELAAQHAALEALADPITPLPSAAPVKTRTGMAWPPRLDAVNFLRGLAMAVMVRARVWHLRGAGTPGSIRRRSGFGKPRRKA
ncbi:MAG: hypothetical protein K2X67_04530 [Burkholderiales bacterium]|nr:hypothetical protein [Burkholderiales bacterium]